MRMSGVQSLLMGGQACVLYGAAEFSRDADLAIVAESDNLQRIEQAMAYLKAVRIAVPSFEKRYLEMGLAVHFRCGHSACAGLRIDMMAKMRGVAPFADLWNRRTTYESAEGPLEVLGLPDLVQAKKTQRAKDWPMITRLVESNYFRHQGAPTKQQVEFWLRELRTASLLEVVAREFPDEAAAAGDERPLLKLATADRVMELEQALREEEWRERDADRVYWLPLRRELERLRSAARQPDGR
jgi:hypothetical protein